MGVLIIILNSYVIVMGVKEMLKLHSGTIKSNQIVIIGIAIADWFMGAYLMVLFIVDVYYLESFCQHKYERLTSKTCAAIGVLYTSSSILSLLIMSVGGVIKLLLLSNKLSMTKGKHHWAMLACVICALMSLAIACIPFRASLEDYFKNGIYYSQSSTYPTLASIESHLRFIETYKSLNNDTTATLKSWQYIKEYISTYCVGSSCKRLNGKPLHFYGNHKTCLFKYLVSSNDPQRVYCHVIEGVMLFLFGFIVICYFYLFKKSRSLYHSDGMVKGNKEYNDHLIVQIKVSLVTISNLLIWAPFLIVCLLLQTLELHDHIEYIL